MMGLLNLDVPSGFSKGFSGRQIGSWSVVPVNVVALSARPVIWRAGRRSPQGPPWVRASRSAPNQLVEACCGGVPAS
jgi:hypothetical protein